MKSLAIFLVCFVANSFALDNGLALKPPMGWLSWTRFACNTDCDTDPRNCISEDLIKEQAFHLARDFKSYGYEYVIIDDCWLARSRDPNTGKLRPDPKRFPSGIKALADHIHGLGLKFGIYQDIGSNTCAGYPGIDGNYKLDADTFAEWGVDYVKVDGCNADEDTLNKGYPAFGKALLDTGRDMVYSCEWPLYVKGPVDEKAVADTCNLWRNCSDVVDSFKSLQDGLRNFAKHQDAWADVIKPGAWNDMDMMTVGGFGLSYDESKLQFATWATLASPLLMSNDLRDIRPELKEILLNKDIIAVNQDPLGLPGRKMTDKQWSTEAYVREVSPVVNGHKSVAMALRYPSTYGGPAHYNFKLSKVGLFKADKYDVKDLFTGEMIYSDIDTNKNIEVLVNPSGATMLKIIPKA